MQLLVGEHKACGESEIKTRTAQQPAKIAAAVEIEISAKICLSVHSLGIMHQTFYSRHANFHNP